MAKINNLPASAYAGRAKEALADLAGRANMGKADTVNMSVGNISKAAGDIGAKTTGTVTRGNGCATKGTMARGPMA
jgi:hypothetical protein